MDAELLISGLKAKQDVLARSALQVSDGTAFDYGKVVGINLGLQHALNHIENILESETALEKTR